VFSFTSWPLYSREIFPDAHRIGWMSPISGLDGSEKCLSPSGNRAPGFQLLARQYTDRTVLSCWLMCNKHSLYPVHYPASELHSHAKLCKPQKLFMSCVYQTSVAQTSLDGNLIPTTTPDYFPVRLDFKETLCRT
jgi:hypothetical protein